MIESDPPGETPPAPPVGAPLPATPAVPAADRGRRIAPERPGIGRRREGWQEFRDAYPGVVTVLLIAILVAIAADMFLIYKRYYYAHEISRLRGGMTTAERKKTDMLMNNEQNRFRLIVELIRRQSLGDKTLHISISADSSTMYLEREGALLREMPVEMGPEKSVGVAPDTVVMARPRGARTVVAILQGGGWEIPAWVYQDRQMPPPANRTVKGALGRFAIVLDGGTVIYSMPSVGPLADSAYVLPGSVRARSNDIEAMLPNLKPGMTVYFY